MRLLALALSLGTPLALANSNDVECTRQNNDGTRVAFSVERGWGTQVRDAHLYEYADGSNTPTVTDYRIWGQRVQNKRWVYSGDRIRLEVDVFPDPQPRWNKNYRGYLSQSYASDGIMICKFPQVRP